MFESHKSMKVFIIPIMFQKHWPILTNVNIPDLLLIRSQLGIIILCLESTPKLSKWLCHSFLAMAKVMLINPFTIISSTKLSKVLENKRIKNITHISLKRKKVELDEIWTFAKVLALLKLMIQISNYKKISKKLG